MNRRLVKIKMAERIFGLMGMAIGVDSTKVVGKESRGVSVTESREKSGDAKVEASSNGDKEDKSPVLGKRN